VTPTISGSTVGYPSDSLASCSNPVCLWMTARSKTKHPSWASISLHTYNCRTFGAKFRLRTYFWI